MQNELSGASFTDIYNLIKADWQYQAVFAVMGLVLAGGLVRMVLEKLRVKNIRSLAQGSGLAYEEYPRLGFDPRALGPSLFGLGDYSSCRHALKDLSALPGAWYLDYTYTISRRRKSHADYNFALALFNSGGLALPKFDLAPENLAGRAADLVTKRDIDLPQSPAFSRRYALTGPDRESVTALFSPPLAAVFEQLRGDWRVQAAGGCVIVFKKGRMSAGGYPAFIEEARTIFRAFLADPRYRRAVPPEAAPAAGPDLSPEEAIAAGMKLAGLSVLKPKPAEVALLALLGVFLALVVYALLHAA